MNEINKIVIGEKEFEVEKPDYINNLTSLLTKDEKEAFLESKKIDEKKFYEMCSNIDKYKAIEVAKAFLKVKKFFSQEKFNKPITKEKN